MDVNLLLVGRTGNGKSSTGNSILYDGKSDKKFFIPKMSNESVPEKITAVTGYIDGRKVTVFDGLGIGDVSLDDSGGVDHLIQSIVRVREDCEDWFSAILLVLPFGVRFTRQEIDAVKMLKGIFGKSVLKDHGVIIITRGDNFDADEEDGQNFENWCKEQTGDFKELLEECKDRTGAYRCVLFNNRTKEHTQREKLFSFQKQVMKYTKKNFDDAKDDRKKLLLNSKLPILEKNNKEFLNKINNQIHRIDINRHPETSISELSDILKQLSDHKIDLKNRMQGENLPNNLQTELDVVEMTLTTKLKIAQQKEQLNESRNSGPSMKYWRSTSNDDNKNRKIDQQRNSKDKKSGISSDTLPDPQEKEFERKNKKDKKINRDLKGEKAPKNNKSSSCCVIL